MVRNMEPRKCPYSVRHSEFMTRKTKTGSPQKVLITKEQYIEDIKVRWQIHQYEINKLGEDLNKVAQTVAPYVQKIMDYSVSKYQELRDRYVTIK